MSNARTHTMCAPLTVPYLLIFTSLPHSGENQSPSGVRDPLGVFFFHFILFYLFLFPSSSIFMLFVLGGA